MPAAVCLLKTELNTKINSVEQELKRLPDETTKLGVKGIAKSKKETED